MLLGSSHVLMMVWQLLKPILLDSTCLSAVDHRIQLTMMLVAVQNLTVRDLLVHGLRHLRSRLLIGMRVWLHAGVLHACEVAVQFGAVASVSRLRWQAGVSFCELSGLLERCL